jgi:dethiobiotin synthetase
MHGGLFITGTDTGVGKTYLSALLVRTLRAAGVDAVGIKPFCCGDREDAELLRAASGEAEDLGLINPVWLRVPAAPYAASLVENRALDLATAREAVEVLRSRHAFLVVEGVGGWRVPLTHDYCMSDFAAELGLPVVVAAANRLGALNHTQLTVDAVLRRGVRCGGVVLTHPALNEPDTATVTNRGVLEQILTVPVLGELRHGEESLPAPLLEKLRAGGLVP